MKLRIPASPLVALLLAAAPLPTWADGYVLSSETLPPAGTVMTLSQTSEMSKLPVKITVQDKEIAGELNEKAALTGEISVVSPARMRMEVKDQEISSETTIAGHSQGQKTPPASLKGLVIVFEKKDGHWTSSREDGGELSAEQSRMFKVLDAGRALEADRVIFGDAVRKPGDKWNVEASKIPGGFAALEQVAGTISVEFVEVSQISGVECATIKLTFDVTGQSSPTMQSHLKGEALIHRSIADNVNLDSKMTGQLEIAGKTSSGYDLQASGPVTTVMTNTVKKP